MGIKTETITKTEVFDDYDGKPLDPETESKRYQFNGKTYDLYLSKENIAKVDKFISELVDGAHEVKNRSRASKITASAVVTSEERERRKKVIEAYNKANPDKTTDRYAGPVKAWEADNPKSRIIV